MKKPILAAIVAAFSSPYLFSGVANADINERLYSVFEPGKYGNDDCWISIGQNGDYLSIEASNKDQTVWVSSHIKYASEGEVQVKDGGFTAVHKSEDGVEGRGWFIATDSITVTYLGNGEYEVDAYDETEWQDGSIDTNAEVNCKFMRK